MADPRGLMKEAKMELDHSAFIFSANLVAASARR